MLHVFLWKWDQPNFRVKYTFEHVNIVSQMVRDNLGGVPLRVVCITDEPYGIDPPTETFPLWTDHDNIANATGRHLPSCYRRLKLFDYETQRALGVGGTDRIISLDLDSIVLNPLHELIHKMNMSKAPFCGWAKRGTYHQRVFNGSFWSIIAGHHLQHIWSDFDPATSPRAALVKGFLGSDQGWLSMHFAQRTDVCGIAYPDFASYPQEIRKLGRLDKRTKVVFFHGSRKPWFPEERRSQPWISRYWRITHERGLPANN